MTLTERSQSQETTYYMILSIGKVHKRQIQRESKLVVVGGWEVGGVGSDC